MSHETLLRHLAETRHELETLFNKHSNNTELYSALRRIDDRICSAMSLATKAHKEAKEGYEPAPNRGRPNFNDIEIN